MNSIFRTTIILSSILYIVLYTMPYYDYLWLSQDELKLLAYSRFESIIPDNPYLWNTLFILWLVIAVGLFFYDEKARKAFVAMMILTAILDPLSGLSVSSSIENTLINLVNIFDGALIVMMYFTSVSNNFSSASK